MTMDEQCLRETCREQEREIERLRRELDRVETQLADLVAAIDELRGGMADLSTMQKSAIIRYKTGGVTK